jgi:class 3 adenylate cyclase
VAFVSGVRGIDLPVDPPSGGFQRFGVPSSERRLHGIDEEATVRDLKAHQAVILPMIPKHGGHLIDTAGDGILAEFPSVVNAVECALAVQKTMAERNTNVDPERCMQFRIGVNLGDVIHDEVRVYGDGVNIAARLEAIAEPGGICLSGEAFAHVQKKAPTHRGRPRRSTA